MKNTTLLTILLVLCLFNHKLLAQNATGDVLTIAEQMPEYPGGADSLLSDVTSRLVYPEQCADSGIQGKVYLRFIVNEDGTVSNISAVKGPHPLLNQQAMDGMKGIARFKPGQQNGKPVRVWYTLPINFRIANAAKPITLTDTAFIAIDEYYPGGRKAFDEFIAKNLQFPKQAEAANYEAAIMVKCKLTDSLKLTRPIVVNSLEKYFDDEAIRLISLMPALDASVKSKDFTRTALVIIIEFKLNPSETTTPTFSSRSGGIRVIGNYDMAIADFNNKNYVSAKNNFDKTIKINPRDRDAYFNRAITKIKL